MGGLAGSMPHVRANSSEKGKVAAGVYLLFSPGKRPDRDAVLSAIPDMPLASVSHDPAIIDTGSESGAARKGRWLELLLSGMTFDLLGLEPGPSIEVPEIAHRVGCDAGFDPEASDALVLLPGPHLADGADSLPIVRAMLDLACGLSRRLDEVQTVCWSPARAAVAMPMFCQSVEQWLGGGVFPALGLAGFATDGEERLTSEGLAHFVGQEIVIGRDLSRDRLSATKLAARLIHEIVGTGKVDAPREFVSDEGITLRLSPAADGTTIEVSRM
ncbi:hypothetical protein [Qipengyuania sphaerica]|uniref:hypothetical protein n=1 Tax=Qipengyuania sphaerica TaxID=2867243 RepID=UPI001C87AE1E|nr:hypothetical protein [Qipengyuania sphaerica]MBX7540387.1 hypothetical protein [Qipengyuania sphaerica]